MLKEAICVWLLVLVPVTVNTLPILKKNLAPVKVPSVESKKSRLFVVWKLATARGVEKLEVMVEASAEAARTNDAARRDMFLIETAPINICCLVKKTDSYASMQIPCQPRSCKQ